MIVTIRVPEQFYEMEIDDERAKNMDDIDLTEEFIDNIKDNTFELDCDVYDKDNNDCYPKDTLSNLGLSNKDFI